MSNGLNKVLVIGNLAKDAEVALLGDKDTPKATFRVVTTTGFGGQEHTEGFNCALWGQRAQSLSPYLTKGKRVYVEGEMRTRSYEQNGETKYFSEVRVQNVQLQPQGDGRGSGPPPDKPSENEE
jgi:single-strand DNA-binding protein